MKKNKKAQNYTKNKTHGRIYQATNKENGKIYIGQTTCKLYDRRKGHFGDAKRNRGSMYFANALLKYGPEGFDWIILEDNIPIALLNDREDYWIEKFNSRNRNIGYNIKKGGYNTPGADPETRRKIGEANGIPIYCFQNGKIYRSINQAEQELGITNVIRVLIKQYEQSGGYTFEYAIEGKNYPILPLHPRIQKRDRRIYCHQTGILYDNMEHASKKLKIKKSYISKHIQGERLHVMGYSFEYEIEGKDYSDLQLLPRIEIYESEKLKKSIVCDQTGEVFSSISEAARKYNILRTGISSVLTGRYKCVGDHLTFRYLDENHKTTSYNAKKKIQCITTGEIFDTITEASKHFNIAMCNIRYVLQKKRKYTKGLQFKYV